MTKPGDSQTKKTIRELAKEFPDKSYRELEIYRDADRQEEAQQIPLSESQKKQEELEPIEGEEQDNPTLFDVARDNFKKDLKLRETYEKEHKLRQEAEGELSIMKGLETNRVKEAQARCDQLQDELDRTKKENNDLHNKVADLTEAAKSKDYFEKPDYKFLVDENHRLEQEVLETKADNIKLSRQIEDKLDQLRKSGL